MDLPEILTDVNLRIVLIVGNADFHAKHHLPSNTGTYHQQYNKFLNGFLYSHLLLLKSFRTINNFSYGQALDAQHEVNKQ